MRFFDETPVLPFDTSTSPESFRKGWRSETERRIFRRPKVSRPYVPIKSGQFVRFLVSIGSRIVSLHKSPITDLLTYLLTYHLSVRPSRVLDRPGMVGVMLGLVVAVARNRKSGPRESPGSKSVERSVVVLVREGSVGPELLPEVGRDRELVEWVPPRTFHPIVIDVHK